MASQLSAKRPEKQHFVSLKNLRKATGMKQAEVCAFVTKCLRLPESKPFSEGSLSAIESGKRGASQKTLDAIAAAYGLDEGSIRSDYTPQDRLGRGAA